MLLATKSLEERCEALQNQLAADQKLFAARESELRAQLQRMTEQREAAVTERLKLVEANSELSSMIQRLQEEPAHARVAGLMEKVRLPALYQSNPLLLICCLNQSPRVRSCKVTLPSSVPFPS